MPAHTPGRLVSGRRVSPWRPACRRGLILALHAAVLLLACPSLFARASSQQGNQQDDQATYFRTTFDLGLAQIRWGEFHAHTTYSADAATCSDDQWPDAVSPWDAYIYARNIQDLDFIALSDHAEMPNPSAVPPPHRRAGLDNWESLLEINAIFNHENRESGRPFIVFAGWEYTNTYGWKEIPSGYGHKNVVFRDLDPAILPSERYGASPMLGDAYAADATELWERLKSYRPPQSPMPAGAITIIHTPAKVGDGGDGVDPQDHRTDWNVMDGDFVRNVEIDSKWGCSEGPPPFDSGCLPDPPYHYENNPESDPLTIRTVLYEHWVLEGDSRFRLGFVGGTDSHTGGPANPVAGQCLMPYRGSVTGVAAGRLTRDELWQEIWQRHTLACSTGIRLPMLFAVDTAQSSLLMGESGLHDGRVRVHVLGDFRIDAIDIIVDGCVLFSRDGHTLDETIQLDAGRHYLYARGRVWEGPQEELRVWTSPVYLGEAAY